MIQYNTIQYNTPIPLIQYNTTQYDTPIPVLYISTHARSKSMINQECQRLKPTLTEHYNTIQYHTIRYDNPIPMIQYNTIQYDTPIPVLYISTRARSKWMINQECQRLKPTRLMHSNHAPMMLSVSPTHCQGGQHVYVLIIPPGYLSSARDFLLN